MTVSQDEKKIGIVLGKYLIKNKTQIDEIAIYKINTEGRFELEKLRDFEFNDACP